MGCASLGAAPLTKQHSLQALLFFWQEQCFGPPGASRHSCQSVAGGKWLVTLPPNHPTRRQLRKHKKEQERREFEALQEQGLNPYEVYRVRDAEAAAVQAAAQQAARQQQRKVEIAAALEAEARVHRKQIAKQEFDRQVRQSWSVVGGTLQLC